jgi:hypothetical protein
MPPARTSLAPTPGRHTNSGERERLKQRAECRRIRAVDDTAITELQPQPATQGLARRVVHDRGLRIEADQAPPGCERKHELRHLPRPGPGDSHDHMAGRDLRSHAPRRGFQLYTGQALQGRKPPQQLLGKALHPAISAHGTGVSCRQLVADPLSLLCSNGMRRTPDIKIKTHRHALRSARNPTEDMVPARPRSPGQGSRRRTPRTPATSRAARPGSGRTSPPSGDCCPGGTERRAT